MLVLHRQQQPTVSYWVHWFLLVLDLSQETMILVQVSLEKPLLCSLYERKHLCKLVGRMNNTTSSAQEYQWFRLVLVLNGYKKIHLERLVLG